MDFAKPLFSTLMIKYTVLLFFLFVGQSIKNVENKMNFWCGKAFGSYNFFPQQCMKHY